MLTLQLVPVVNEKVLVQSAGGTRAGNLHEVRRQAKSALKRIQRLIAWSSPP